MLAFRGELFPDIEADGGLRCETKLYEDGCDDEGVPGCEELGVRGMLIVSIAEP